MTARNYSQLLWEILLGRNHTSLLLSFTEEEADQLVKAATSWDWSPEQYATLQRAILLRVLTRAQLERLFERQETTVEYLFLDQKNLSLECRLIAVRQHYLPVPPSTDKTIQPTGLSLADLHLLSALERSWEYGDDEGFAEVGALALALTPSEQEIFVGLLPAGSSPARGANREQIKKCLAAATQA